MRVCTHTTPSLIWQKRARAAVGGLQGNTNERINVSAAVSCHLLPQHLRRLHKSLSAATAYRACSHSSPLHRESYCSQGLQMTSYRL